jgi:beta-glucanase (GH16 family)
VTLRVLGCLALGQLLLGCGTSRVERPLSPDAASTPDGAVTDGAGTPDGAVTDGAGTPDGAVSDGASTPDAPATDGASTPDAPATDGASTLDGAAGDGAGPLDGAASDDASAPEDAGTTVFFDDFTTSSAPDPARWAYPLDPYGLYHLPGRQEVNLASQLQVNGGTLTIVTERANTVDPLNGQTFPFRSGQLTTYRTFGFRYGTVEARLKVPFMAGPAWTQGANCVWPAFWMMPTTGTPAANAQIGEHSTTSPEIDILEMYGDSQDAADWHVHWSLSPPDAATAYYPAVEYSTDFHVWGLEWAPSHLRFFVDGVQYGEVTSRIPGSPYFYFIWLNVAVGYAPGWTPTASTPDTSVTEVDWVRVTANEWTVVQ